MWAPPSVASVTVSDVRGLPYWSATCTVTVVVDVPSATTVDGDSVTPTCGAAGLTCSEAVPVAPALVPVTVCAPAAVAVHTLAVHDPFGVRLNVVVPVTSPRLLLLASRPCAVNVWLLPAVTVALAGESTRWSSAPGWTVTGACVADNAPSVTVTHWLPAVRSAMPVKVWLPASAAVNV